ncbi:hypothetical protein OA86_08760 [Kaistella jeonii]|uniref:DUF559 domain-containing protein n=2 Tax=Kaistella jeonii TaxID=266749 RepID=A0A0C1D5Y9_9FLAO|nr:hypothetical protein OA86_08760 [Kaistella jeonii]
MSKGAPAVIFDKARELRLCSTSAEIVLWEKLRNNQLDQLTFRRQHPVGVYITDFYCHRLKLVIEVDGGYHLSEEQQKKDNERTAYLVANGLQVIRFTNHEVEHTIDKVIAAIRAAVSKINPSK